MPPDEEAASRCRHERSFAQRARPSSPAQPMLPYAPRLRHLPHSCHARPARVLLFAPYREGRRTLCYERARTNTVRRPFTINSECASPAFLRL